MSFWVWSSILFWTVSVALGSGAAGASEGEISAKVEVDRAFATIGDPIHFRITVRHAKQVTILESDPSRVLVDFEIKEVSDFSYEEKGEVAEGKNYVISSHTQRTVISPALRPAIC